MKFANGRKFRQFSILNILPFRGGLERLHMQSLPGIISIGYIPCKLLQPDITLCAMSGVPVSVPSPTNVELTGAATCESTTSPDNNTQLEKATLTFYTTDDSIPIGTPLAFVATTVQGQSYIIGRYEQPYPSVKRTRTTGVPDGDRSVLKYEVTFSALHAIVPCSE